MNKIAMKSHYPFMIKTYALMERCKRSYHKSTIGLFEKNKGILSIFCGSIVFLLTLFNTLHADDRQHYHQEGLDFGRNEGLKAFDFIHSNSISSDDLLSKEDQGKEFDPDDAKRDVLSSKRIPSPLDFLESPEVVSNLSSSSLDKNERFLQEDQYDLHKDYIHTEICIESASPIEFSIIRNLILDGVTVNEHVISTKVCLGHQDKEKVKRRTGYKRKNELEKNFSQNPNIAKYKVTVEEKGFGHRDVVWSSWWHVDNNSFCNHSKNIETDTFKIVNIAGESWRYDNKELYAVTKSSNCSLLSQSCLDDRPRVIDGHELKRCFVEKLNFLWNPPKSKGCHFLRSELCDLKSSRCLLDGPFGCAQWERTFQCYRNLKKKEPPKIEGSEIVSGTWDTGYVPNGNFGDVVTKLAVFREMDSDLKKSEIYDIERFEFFLGQSKRCFVNEISDITYDCCDRMGGFTNDIKVSHCDAEEIELFNRKQKGQCHYVGHKDEKIFGAKTSKRHVYCCFGSKLARVFQERAREQLGVGWGSAESPNCQGFKRGMLSKIDMTKLNLTEAFDASDLDVSEKLERLTKKLQGSLAQ